MIIPPSWKESSPGTEFWAKHCFSEHLVNLMWSHQPSGHSLGGNLPFPLGAFGKAPFSLVLCNTNAGVCPE